MGLEGVSQSIYLSLALKQRQGAMLCHQMVQPLSSPAMGRSQWINKCRLEMRCLALLTSCTIDGIKPPAWHCWDLHLQHNAQMVHMSQMRMPRCATRPICLSAVPTRGV